MAKGTNGYAAGGMTKGTKGYANGGMAKGKGTKGYADGGVVKNTKSRSKGGKTNKPKGNRPRNPLKPGTGSKYGPQGQKPRMMRPMKEKLRNR